MMLHTKLLVFCVFGLISACVGQFVERGQCNDAIPIQQDFNLQRFSGLWYEIETYPKIEQPGQCISHQFNVNSDTTYSLNSLNVVDQTLSSTTGQVRLNPNQRTGQLTITIPGPGQTPEEIPYWILATDYENYALAYSCVNINSEFREVRSWKLSRTKQLSAASNTLINNAIQNNVVLDNRNYEPVDQSDSACFLNTNLGRSEPVVLPGLCDPNVPVVPNFNAARYLGKWRLIETYFSDFQFGTCNNAEYTLNADGSVNVFNTEVVNQTLTSMTGRAFVVDNGKLSVTFPTAPVATDYWVLDTDYDSFALVYSCTNITASNQRRVFSWKLSRTNSLSANAINRINQIINTVDGLENRFFQPVNRSAEGCFYFPETDGRSTVLFRGQCDESIPVVTGFNAARYLGLWHDVESYPGEFQFGSCMNALYSLREDGNVDVFNTQVVNQTLLSIRGVASLVPSTDGSAKLEVSFSDEAGNLTNYWVLSTDYDSYSLVYSCRNVSDEYKAVYLWKLSRTKTLTNEAATAINRVISGYNVMDQRYFVRRDQSPTGCFYFPEPQAGVPVVFPGQCDNNVQAMANFNIDEFSGLWYETEAYPKIEQPGQCINHQFTRASSTSYSLNSLNVVNRTLTSTTGQVTLNPNQNTGRMTITIPGPGQTRIEIPYWVLATDYRNYALAYSCVNINSDFRGVWSWKLSRTKQLSAASNTLINNAIQNNVVLDNRYYEPIDQSDRACFHYPNLGPTEPVVLPGLCDPNVPVVPNFNAARYLGKWRLIETYYADFQFGTCSNAEYTLNADGSVNVFNTEVVNQTLTSMTGRAVVVDNAKLSVTFPVAPVASDYWVLDTDYDSFALVYSCTNITATNQRRVSSWKLSRTNSLSANAINRINQVINTVDALDNRYYQPVDRTEAGCFYFPETDGRSTVLFRGQCDESIPVVTGFNAARYLGLWHDVESYPGEFQFGSCMNALYSLREDGNVDVFNTQVVNQTLLSIRGVASLVPSTDGSAKLEVSFSDEAGNLTNYWVLSTDYDSYSLVYSCRNVSDEYKAVYLWKLSRTKTLTNEAATAINRVISGYNVMDQRYFVRRDQSPTGCFYFPEPQAGVPVVFPGQCDNNVQAVPNFNIDEFSGLWHEIEAYPKIEQPGQCINHQFTRASSTSYSLNSLNVVNRTLTSTTGQVTLNPNQNTGRMTITITGPGQTRIEIPYWVLATDYRNYALAYSCVNINSDFRGVWSWKLSRTKQLSAASNTLINNAIQNNVVLDNRYYEPIDQSDSACLYFPDLGPTDPVVLPGLCDPNIPVVPNFNAARYLGKWRLIESYFTANQRGTCNNAEYTLAADGSVTVFNTHVVNQTLTSMTGRAVLVDNGKLSVTFPNSPQPTDYWVLDTDYDSFALVYSCTNITATNQRRVFGWKLSRTNSLTANAVNRINQVINTVDVLDNRFFQPVDRSSEGCFYFPETDGRSTVLFRGQCDESIPVVTGFNAARYLGLWHDVESYPGEFQFGSCMNALYSLREDGNVDVFNTQVVNQTLLSIRGVASLVPSTDGSAKLEVSFSDEAGNLTNYWVLSTDYDSYSLVYSCRNVSDEYKAVYLWKLSRTKSLTNEAATAINRVISGYNVMDQRYFVRRDQSPTGCFYFPEPQAGVPVVFPGQCDNNVQAVPNFNIDEFSGLWHEIEAYPKIEQPGQCINHQFTRVSSTSYSLNSLNVVNRTLTSTTGQVTLNPNQSTGRLTITIPGPGQTRIEIPYWVLATDYRNYALAYSCVNINSDFRGVWSWKLSRTKQLSAASNTLINNAIQNNVVLDNRYYEPIDQSDSACFHIPNFGPTDPVVLPGLCDPNIPVVPNFNAARYLGKWRLIETFYSDFQFGTCNNAEYTLNADGSVNVFNTEVVNQTLTSMTGRAVVVDNAKLSVTFPTAPVATDYWVLDTDYDSFALVYSCTNITATNQRRVFGWKLSRTNSLTANAVNRINQVINTVDVLDNRFFQPVNRSAEGCFYFPETDGRSTVLFRGQCDESIPVVTGFNAARYLGLWHDVESYPGEFQFGSCMNALYSLREDGNVDVFNTQVVNQTLLSIRGVASLVPSTDGSAKLEVSFSDEAGNLTNYWVLSTDYDSYSLVYSCRNVSDEYKAVYLWKLSRTKSLTNEAATAINRVISGYNVMDQRYFVRRDQSPTGCFYFPEPQAGVPVVFPGQCDNNVQAVPNFNIDEFSGLWHEIEAYPKIEQPGQCINHQFNRTSSTSYSLNSLNVVNQTLTSTTGQVTLNPNQSTGRLTITISGPGQTRIEIPYWVLATDYRNYALAYSCVNINSDFRGVWSWKLSRTKQLSATSNTLINNAIQNNVVLDNRYYEPIDQSDNACFHYPNFGPTDPVVLPGLCDPTIPVVPNFNAARYLGKWRLIETYYSDFQFGVCNIAEYSLAADGSVTVFNTEVVNQTLTSMTGRAVVVDNAKLSVTFPTAPVATDYWILDTDYDSYALVYSCTNITATNQRRVFSWKLSRTRSLSNQANAAMAAIIERTQGLNQRYFQPNPQTDEACFYVPELNVTQAPRFRGRCEDITPMANFNRTRYLGWWHEIRRYPVDGVAGECISSRYEESSDTIRVVDTSISNNSANTVEGTVTISDNGRLTRRLSDGRVEEIWVLATDYDNFALLYSCEELDNGYRKVWSAQHSKSRSATFSPAAQQAMNARIQNIQALINDFYLPVNQSDEACFHYPVQTGPQVILPGQCDPNIPFQANFDIENFAGTWYEIERYDEVGSRTCIGTRFTYNANSQNVAVVEFENVGGALVTRQGTAQVQAANATLIITVPDATNAPVITNLVILSTNYENSTLAYTCENINQFYRRVGAWKLSRTRSWQPTGAITTLIANRPELHEPYFRPISHNADCLEPSSSFLVKSSIIVILLCSVLQLIL